MLRNSPRRRGKLRAALTALTVLAVAGSAAALPAAADTAADPLAAGWNATAYRGQVEVVRTPEGPADPSVLTGHVFVDRDRDSTADRNERGLAGVVVSNGRDVVTTDRRGRYELPVYDNMTVFVTQPSGYQVPVDEANVAQFHYHHLPEGSPQLRYGGLAPTGPLPDAVNFPLVRSGLTRAAEQHCVMAGDLQTYNETEVEYARRGAISDLAGRHDYQGCGTLFVGDVVGDDLSLYPDVRELTGLTNGPARFLPGNHDLDFDSASPEHAFDTFRAQLAPTYYSYDVGDVHIVALNTVRYPCTPDDDINDRLGAHCDDPENTPRYIGWLDEEQLAWLERDLARVDEDKLVVVAGHIGLLNFADEGSAVHQVAQVREVYELLEGRRAVAIAGHSHSVENMRTGDLVQGWNELFGIEGLPFPHITAGAISGDWYSGELTEHGYPLAVGRDGAPPGLLTLDIRRDSFRERYTATGRDDGEQTQLGINSPTYREWYAERQDWNDEPVGEAPELGDPLVVDREDLAGTTWLTTNFWIGSTGSTVEVSIDRGRARPATRTQPLQGEDQRIGPEWSDPYAAAQQLVNGGSLADRAMHIWRYELPADLDAGPHRAVVTATDAHGRAFTDVIDFHVVEER
ncbi:calcineurin-like phosphoesterase C-terminal domain-containing protein [Allonocardiopsis opalescens]|uniref:Calcineurin-like phosphoesterase family protein n=1 Tax=Allonocardiopsis opalescens TaxID=1144618 RepID=A0A2T0PYL8_9ACTN|nr:calcineurin-like phosphoesterase family protein [Allonocardiopsis opalescens]PRX96635.1 calcineurin-like phosphoesterase family protein [Allonocardiopsis opalescens]